MGMAFLVVVNSLMLLWISSRTSFAAWWLFNPENQMVLSIDNDSFCKDICLDMKCGAVLCDAVVCESQCNVSLDAKMNIDGGNMHGMWSSSSSSSSSSEENEEYGDHHHGHYGHESHDGHGHHGHHGEDHDHGDDHHGMHHRMHHFKH